MNHQSTSDRKANDALLISIRPRYAAMIFAGTKTIELRRMRPRLKNGDMVFVYVSSPVKALEGAFEVAEILSGPPRSIWRQFGSETGLSRQEFDAYCSGKSMVYGIKVRRCWRLADPIMLANLKKRRNGFHPPQSYHYISEREFRDRLGLQSLTRAGHD